MNRHLNSEEQECVKTSHAKGKALMVGGDKRKKKVNMVMYFLCKYGYGTFKPVEIAIRRGLR
jgi:hypothetical protein